MPDVISLAVAEARSDSGTIVAILAALSPVFLAFLGGIGWLYRHERERRIEIERQLSQEKYKAYIALIDLFFGMLKAQALGEDPRASLVTGFRKRPPVSRGGVAAFAPLRRCI